MWTHVLTLALGIFFGLGAFAAVLALLFAFFDRQETKRKERKEVEDLTTRVRTLEAENQRLRQQLNPQVLAEDEDYRMMVAEAPAQEAPRELVVTVDVCEAVERAAVSEEPRPTRYDRIEDNEPPV